MSENSKIEWCDHTFNPWIGCTKVSPGCAHCYAEARDQRFAGGIHWGKGAPRQLTSESNWRLPVKWNAAVAAKQANLDERRQISDPRNEEPGIWKARRPRVFCASLADWLDDEVPIEWLARLLKLIAATPHFDWLLLSKRPQNWHGRMSEVRDWCIKEPGKSDFELHLFVHEWLARADREPPANVWIGTTVEDQVRADERIPALLSIPARVRFLSCEPLLSEVNIGPFVTEPTPMGKRILQRHHTPSGEFDATGSQKDYEFQIKEDHGLHWVICGGESGSQARPMHPDWARGLREQCSAAGVPFLFKQWGEFAPCFATASIAVDGQEKIAKGNFTAWSKVGKHAAGRLLDGITHTAFPA